MNRFLIIIEDAGANFAAYAPDLPGCVAAGRTREEVEHNMYGAIEMHLEGMLEDNLPIPEPTSSAEYIEMPVRG